MLCFRFRHLIRARMTPSITSAIRERGFRKWYERELTRGHLHLVLLLACAVGALGALEALSQARGGDRLLVVASLLIAVGVGAWAGRRYLFHLMRAELIASQAVCNECRTYARWRVEREDAAAEALAVRCANCGHRWRIDC